MPRESVPCYATNDSIIVAESLIGDILNEVQSGLGYADARAKSNAIWQYRDMYLRPDFYINNIERVHTIIAPVIEDYKSGKITYTEAEFNARIAIYQSVNLTFNSDVEFAKDSCYRDIPSVDSSLFIIARKLLLDSKFCDKRSRLVD